MNKPFDILVHEKYTGIFRSSILMIGARSSQDIPRDFDLDYR